MATYSSRERADHLGLGLEPLLVGVEHVEGGAGAEPRLLGHALGGDARGLDLLAAGDDRGARDDELRPGLAHRLGHGARGVLQLEAALVEQRLRLAHQAVVAGRRCRAAASPATPTSPKVLPSQPPNWSLPRSTPTEAVTASCGPLAASARSKS